MNSHQFNRLFKKFNTDTQAFNLIYKEYYPKVVLHIKRTFGNLLSAEDVAQNLFIKLLSMEQKSEDVQYPTAWLFKLAENLAIDELRVQHIDAPLNDYLSAPINTDFIIKDEARNYFLHLDETTQKILYMHIWEGYTYKEIAMELNLSHSNVRVKVCRALKNLRKFL